jgi:hypothetical protein
MAIEKREMIYLENWIADRIEPLVVTLAALADETRLAMQSHEREIERRNQEAERLQKENERLQRQWNQNQEDMILKAHNVVSGLRLKFIMMCMAVGIVVGMTAPSAYVLMEYRYSDTAERMKRIDENWNRLPPDVQRILDGK